MKFAFVEVEKVNHSVELLCQVLDVSRSGFYAWRTRVPSKRSIEDEQLKSTLRKVRKGPKRCYGAPRMKCELEKHHKFVVGRRRTARLMREMRVCGIPKKQFVPTTDSNHDYKIAPNLLDRKFDVPEPDQVSAGDITYISTTGGMLFLAVILDLCTREVVGWSLADHMRTELVSDAFRDALANNDGVAPKLFHSDQGSQYASNEYQELLRCHGVVQSMSRRGNCWDNAVVESFYRSLKHEGLTLTRLRNTADAELAVFRYINAFYNTERLHSALGYMSPTQYREMIA